MVFQKGNKIGNRFKKGAEQSEIGRKGAEASNRVQREKKMMKKLCEEELNKILSNGKSMQENAIQKLEALLLDKNSKNVNVKDLLAFLIFMRDTSGQKPVEKVAQTDSNGLDIQIVNFSDLKEKEDETD